MLEKQNFENQKDQLIKINGLKNTDIVKLNVGGSLQLASTRNVLCSAKDSILE